MKSSFFKYTYLIMSGLILTLLSCGTDEIVPPDDPILPEQDDNTGGNENEDDKEDVETPSGPKKNILFIMADDFNYWVNCLGYYQTVTPNLDALADKGVLFTNAFCSSPVSNPSRNAMWSGYRPSTTGIDNNPDGYVRDKQGFQNIVTMNQYFMNNGYHVLGAGKLYHPGQMGGHETDPDNWSQLFTDKTGSQATGGKFKSWDYNSADNGNLFKYNVGYDDPNPGNTNDLALVNKVADFIKNYETSENADKPFFIGCGVFRPHQPWNFSKKYWDMYPGVISMPKGYKDGDRADTPSPEHAAIVQAGEWENCIHAYLSCLTMADEHVGILLDALNSTRYKDNTIVVFMGDHGWHLGEKERWGKNTIYNQANRTTLIIYDPSRAGEKHVCDIPVSLQDIYPTLVKLSNIPKKADIEGNDISSLVEDPERSDWNVPVMSTYDGTNYVQDRYYKYIADNKGGKKLYRIDTDPYEYTNIFVSNQAIANRYQAKIDSILDIGDAIRSNLGVRTLLRNSVMLKGYPSSVIRACTNYQLVNRKVLLQLNRRSGEFKLDLLNTDPMTKLSVFSSNGLLLDEAYLVGEMEVSYKAQCDIADAKYIVITDDRTVSVEEINY